MPYSKAPTQRVHHNFSAYQDRLIERRARPAPKETDWVKFIDAASRAHGAFFRKRGMDVPKVSRVVLEFAAA